LAKLEKKGKKVGKLRFKGKGWLKTFCYNQSGFKIIKRSKRLDKLHLSKIGDIPIRIPRGIDESIKQILIKKYNSGKWYACISVEADNEMEQKPIQRAVGLDMGIKHFSTDLDGLQIENPHYLKHILKKLRKEQRRFSRKKKKSKNREKQRIKVAKVHEKIINQRNNILHKLSRYYVNNYNLIAIENLNVKGMVKNHHLSSSISDVSWSTFAQMLAYKAENAGRIVVKVDPRNTSQRCSRCGRIVKKSLAVRTHRCPSCGLELNRDYNSARDILKSGLEKLPQGLREFKPVELGPLRELETIPASSIVEAGSHFLTSR
jgi:putative transposase